MSSSAKSRKGLSGASSVKDYDFEKVVKYCSFRPRNRFELDRKMIQMGLCASIRKRYLSQLKKMGLIQDDEYLKSYINGKVRINHWGKIKITHYLKKEGFSVQSIKTAISKFLNPEDYEKAATTALKQRYRFFSKKGYSASEIKLRCTNYLISKGFEESLARSLCHSIIQPEFRTDSE